MRSLAGPTRVVAGIALIIVGVIAWSGMLSWFGRLPGDIRIEREHTRLYIPITSMIVVSIVLSLLVAVARRMR
jgi:hypothetical protein